MSILAQILINLKYWQLPFLDFNPIVIFCTDENINKIILLDMVIFE